MIILDSEHIAQMRSHAQAIYPEECCGIILGWITPTFKEAFAIIPVENSWHEELGEILPFAGKNKNDRFFIAPKALLKGQKLARDRQGNIIGIYHSHPDHQALPSECDRSIAWAEYSYIILSVFQGNTQEVLSWQLDNQQQFQPEVIRLKTKK